MAGGVKMSDFATTTQVSSADKIPIIRGSGGSTENLLVPFTSLTQSIAMAYNPPSESAQTLENPITLNVGTGGDYETLTEALVAASRYYPVYSQSGYEVTINLMSGFVLSEQIIVYGIDLSHVNITGTDPSTTIARSALTVSPGAGMYPAFAAMKGARLPYINQLFVMDTSGTSTDRVGLLCHGGGSVANIDTTGAGFNDAPLANVVAIFGGEIKCNSANLDGGGITQRCAMAQDGGKVYCSSALITNAANYGAYSVRGGYIVAASCDATGAGTYGYYVGTASNISAASSVGTLSQAANVQTADGLIVK